MLRRLIGRGTPAANAWDEPLERFLRRVAALSDEEWLRVADDRRTIPRVANPDAIGHLIVRALEGDRGKAVENAWAWCRDQVSPGVLRARRRWIVARPDFTSPEELVRDSMSATAGIILRDLLPPGGLALVYGPFRSVIPSAFVGLFIDYPQQLPDLGLDAAAFRRGADAFLDAIARLESMQWGEILTELARGEAAPIPPAWARLLPRAQSSYPREVQHVSSRAMLLAAGRGLGSGGQATLAHAIIRATLAALYQPRLSRADFLSLTGPFRHLSELGLKDR